ncbi:MAG: hypothetical protein MJ212_01145 [Alphaproteobacteria bacterium]|nr:hypothetical protein [Alphaproteobacteria bacterium]
MKKYFCFHCQQDVTPYKILKWRICPQCKKIMSDTGDGFYRVCDKCGSNMPSDAQYCLQCGHNLIGGADKNTDMDKFMSLWRKNMWQNSLLSILLLFSALLIVSVILYFSFYFIIVFAVLGAVIGLTRYFINLFK